MMEIIEKSEIENMNYEKMNKDELIHLYINEGKSLNEISIIYRCDRRTVKSKLKKYGIPIRPHGAFLVDDDGKSMYSKYNKGEIILSEYKNKQANNRGYNNCNEYERERRHKTGKCLSMGENKECSKYLGVHICENKEFLSKIINIVESMQCNNPGYDIVCGKGEKVDVKCSCLICDKGWIFHIKENKIADRFLMIAFDNRNNLKIEHIWLVKGNTFIEKTNHRLSEDFIFNNKDVVSIDKGYRALKRWKKYEKTNILEEAQKLCDIFKDNNIKNNDI